MFETNSFSEDDNQYSQYIEIGLIGRYDLSPTLREKHRQYIKEYRICLMEIYSYTSSFKDKDDAKATICYFMQQTILANYEYTPSEGLKSIIDLNENNNAEFQRIIEEIKKRKPVKHSCPKCNKVINITADYRRNNFHCMKCFENVRRVGH